MAQNPDARLMASLTSNLENMALSGGPKPSALHNAGFPHPEPKRVYSSNELPKGRRLTGDHVLYDIDVRLPGEEQPPLLKTPITEYGSDPSLVLGRRIAVNKTYICYGLKLGAIRIINSCTASRSLLKGLYGRMTDIAFFADDINLLASASAEGRVYIWKVTEVTDEEDKVGRIIGKIVIPVEFTGEGKSVHPLVCWHCDKQEVLVVGIGRRVLKIDTKKIGKGEDFSAEDPLKCPVNKLIDGVQLVGNHDGEVTDLSMCQWMTRCYLVSASVDGMIKIWEDGKMLPMTVLRPHDGNPVNSVTLMSASHRPDHIILITGGPLNREVKLWAQVASVKDKLILRDSESWVCTQSLELKSSSESRVEESFFNQVVALPEPGLLFIANAKKNAIYAVHLDYGSNPASTRMDYISEFTVNTPVLSFAGMRDMLPDGDQIVALYCVHTEFIQQLSLDLSLCSPPPPPMDNAMLDMSDSIQFSNSVSEQ